ncbi:hypothetical protein BKA63DRAFT_311069 [Paraphoma chrysanthemicola]|nr:hypothetical protein BKA63DRAFT_311069 [Paraphoma chrysanthemicola]
MAIHAFSSIFALNMLFCHAFAIPYHRAVTRDSTSNANGWSFERIITLVVGIVAVGGVCVTVVAFIFSDAWPRLRKCLHRLIKCMQESHSSSNHIFLTAPSACHSVISEQCTWNRARRISGWRRSREEAIQHLQDRHDESAQTRRGGF